MTEAPEEEQKLGKYTLLRKLAQGGMAEIFLATQHGAGGFQKQLVIKRILPHLADDKKFVEMFLDEARIAAQFNDPNIVQIYDLGEADGQYFIAMEYIDGFDLSQLIDRALHFGKRVPAPVAAKIIRDGLNGLHYAHTFTNPQSGEPLKLVHRDISPQNLLVNKGGVVKLVDFGVAKAKTSSSKTQTGAVKGKFSYMAPEQIAGEVLDARCDIFAMGIVFYELLLGVRPFGEHSDLMAITAIVHQPPKSPREIDDTFPEELEEILMKSLAKNRDERYSSALDMQEAIEEYMAKSGQVVSTRGVSRYLDNLFSDSPSLDDIGFGAGATHALKMTELQSSSGESPSVSALDTSRTNAAPPVVQSEPQAQTQPDAFAGPPIEESGGNSGLVIAVIIVALLVLGGGGFLAYMMLTGDEGSSSEESAEKDKDPTETDVTDEPDVSESDVGSTAVNTGEADVQQEADVPSGDVASASDVAVASQDVASDVNTIEGEPDTVIASKQDVSHIEPENLPGAAADTAPGFGEVKLTSNLKARIFYKKQRVGRTPALLSFPSGEVEITLKDEKNNAEKSFRITVFDGRRYETELKIETGRLILRTVPDDGFSVKIDGKKMGKTPLKPVTLYEGPHEVEISGNGRKKKKYIISIMPGDNPRRIRIR